MVALPNPSFAPKTHRWRPGAVAPSWEVPSQICAVLGQKQPFSPKIAPIPGRNAQTKDNSGHTSRAASLHRDKEPSSALQLHDMSEKRPKKEPKSPQNGAMCTNPRNQARTVSWATWLKIRFREYLVHPQPPTFCGFQPSESPNETPRHLYQWSLGTAGGQPGPRTVGANGGSTRVPGAKKKISFKVVPRPPGMLKHVFLARFAPVGARFGQ